jgi:hypothetical protein
MTHGAQGRRGVLGIATTKTLRRARIKALQEGTTVRRVHRGVHVRVKLHSLESSWHYGEVMKVDLVGFFS